MTTKTIYIRTSTEEQNPENQLKDCESMFEGDYELYRDQQSAYKDNVERKDFNRLRQDIKYNKVKDIYVWDFDRVFRNRIKFKQFLEFLKAYKCKLHSFNQKWMENINNIPEPWNEIVSDMLIQIFGYIAEEESTLKGKRIRNAMRMKKDGVYSYKGNKWGRKRVSSQKKNKIRELYNLNNKISIRSLCGETGLSVGAVHKYLKQIKEEKQPDSRVFAEE